MFVTPAYIRHTLTADPANEAGRRQWADTLYDLLRAGPGAAQWVAMITADPDPGEISDLARDLFSAVVLTPVDESTWVRLTRQRGRVPGANPEPADLEPYRRRLAELAWNLAAGTDDLMSAHDSERVHPEDCTCGRCELAQRMFRDRQVRHVRRVLHTRERASANDLDPDSARWSPDYGWGAEL